MNKEELDKLEKETDIAAINYFEALVKEDELVGKLAYMRVELTSLRNAFQRTKMAHLKAKHGIKE